MEQKLPLQNRLLYISGFSGETGRPRFFHIIPLQNGSLYFWWFSFFQVAILLKCVLTSGSPLCRGQWFWKSQKCTKKRDWVPWFCRENPLLDLWQVPHSVEAWGAKSQIWLYKMGTPNPPRSLFGIIMYICIYTYVCVCVHIHICIYIIYCIFIQYIHVCMYTYAYAYAYIYIYNIYTCKYNFV